MARFVFELESVLKQRRAVERQKQLALAELERDRARLEDVIRSFQAEITREKVELRDQLVSCPGAAIDFRGVRFQASTTLRLMTRAQHAVLQLAGVHNRAEVARRELIEATTRRKAVETLRERRYEAWRDAQNRAESAALDELAVMAASRSEELS